MDLERSANTDSESGAAPDRVDSASAPAATIHSCLAAARRIGLVRTRNAGAAVGLGRALIDGGIEAVEVSFVTPQAPDVIAALVADGRGIIGAGTVRDALQARAALRAGARFLVSPGQPANLGALAHAAGALAILGGLTPTEILAARDLGADFVKVFPIRAVGGLGYLRDILAPLPDIPLLVSGGVNHANYREYLEAGAALCMLGSQLVPAELIEARDWRAIARHVRAALQDN